MKYISHSLFILLHIFFIFILFLFNIFRNTQIGDGSGKEIGLGISKLVALTSLSLYLR